MFLAARTRTVMARDQTTVRGQLAGIALGDADEVAVMGALNVSPESFYGGSVVTRDDDLRRAADRMARGGAAAIDVGAMSTAPYLKTRISEGEEAERLAAAVRLVVQTVAIPVSADTSRVAPARAALDAGARVINDVTGLAGDPGLGGIVAGAGAGLILMVSEHGPGEKAHAGDPVDVVSRLLCAGLDRARAAGIAPEAVVIDPGVGFFRHGAMPWYEWDCAVLAGLERLRALRRPICVGVSRKSFLGALTGQDDPRSRLPGSLAATAVAVLGGAHLIRTHDVAETVQAVRIAAAVRRARSTPRG